MSTEQEYLALAKNFIDNYEYTVAGKILTTVIKEYPQLAEAFELLGDLFFATNSFDLASGAYQSAIRISPDNSNYASKLASSQLRLEAQAEFQLKLEAELEAQKSETVDFSQLSTGTPRPRRESPFDYETHCLDLAQADYVNGLLELIDAKPWLEGGITIYATGDKGPDILQMFADSPLAPKLDILILEPEQFHKSGNAKFRRSVEGLKIDSNILAIHVDEADSIESILKRLSIESPFFGADSYLNREIEIVFLNYTGKEKNVSEFANLNATLLVTVPRCGSGLFLAPFMRMASIAGRQYKSLSTDVARRIAIFNKLLKNTVDAPNDDPYLPELEQFNIQSIIGLNFCDIGDLHQPCRVGGFSKIPYLDILVLMRDPRDVAVSAAISQIYVNNLETTKETIEAEIAVKIDSYLPAVLATFAEAKNLENCYLVRFENMISDRRAELKNIISWLDWKPVITKKEFEDAIALIETKHLQNLKAAQGEGDNQVTWIGNKNFRKGAVGDWKGHFTDRLKDQLKSTGGQALIDLGYAENFDW